jgi:phosphatidylglycerophosphatase A
MSDRIKLMASTALGTGLAPVAPGTFGTLPAVALFVVIALFSPAGWYLPLVGGALASSCIASVPLGAWAARHWQGKDPSHFVLDEVAGFLLTVLIFPGPLLFGDAPFPLTDPATLAWTALWAFLAFRLFDITKLPLVSHAERLPEGWGILADDLVAAVYAGALLHLMLFISPALFGVG